MDGVCEEIINQGKFTKRIIIHQPHYEKSDLSRAVNQFTLSCELDVINAISAADIAFIMSLSYQQWATKVVETL